MNVNVESIQAAVFGEYHSTRIQIYKTCLDMQEPVWYEYQTFWYLHYRRDWHESPISKFLDGSSEAMTFSGRLVTFWYSWLLKKGQSWALQMKPLIYMATFEWFHEWNILIEHPVHLSCQVINLLKVTGSLCSIILAFNLILVLAAYVN